MITIILVFEMMSEIVIQHGTIVLSLIQCVRNKGFVSSIENIDLKMTSKRLSHEFSRCKTSKTCHQLI